MPFKSKAQRRKFAQLLVEGKITPEVFEEWNRETGGEKLPERVEQKKKKKKTRTKTTRKRKATQAKRATATRRSRSTTRRRATKKTTRKRPRQKSQ
jgi:hypothetical protein